MSSTSDSELDVKSKSKKVKKVNKKAKRKYNKSESSESSSSSDSSSSNSSDSDSDSSDSSSDSDRRKKSSSKKKSKKLRESRSVKVEAKVSKKSKHKHSDKSKESKRQIEVKKVATVKTKEERKKDVEKPKKYKVPESNEYQELPVAQVENHKSVKYDRYEEHRREAHRPDGDTKRGERSPKREERRSGGLENNIRKFEDRKFDESRDVEELPFFEKKYDWNNRNNYNHNTFERRNNFRPQFENNRFEFQEYDNRHEEQRYDRRNEGFRYDNRYEVDYRHEEYNVRRFERREFNYRPPKRSFDRPQNDFHHDRGETRKFNNRWEFRPDRYEDKQPQKYEPHPSRSFDNGKPSRIRDKFSPRKENFRRSRSRSITPIKFKKSLSDDSMDRKNKRIKLKSEEKVVERKKRDASSGSEHVKTVKKRGSKERYSKSSSKSTHENNKRKQSKSPKRSDDAKWGKDNTKHDKTDDKKSRSKDTSKSNKSADDSRGGVIGKYSEPSDARKPKRRWRLYPFKGEKAMQTIYIHRESAYTLGRERKLVDLPLDHPSCSKQHAAIQYRLVPFTREDGTTGKRIRPFVIDLNSQNGTYLNDKRIETRRYIEIFEKDVIKFGFSTREYVLLHENSKDEIQDDDVIDDDDKKVDKSVKVDDGSGDD